MVKHLFVDTLICLYTLLCFIYHIMPYLAVQVLILSTLFIFVQLKNTVVGREFAYIVVRGDTQKKYTLPNGENICYVVWQITYSTGSRFLSWWVYNHSPKPQCIPITLHKSLRDVIYILPGFPRSYYYIFIWEELKRFING